MHKTFLKYSVEKLRQNEGRIESCLDKLTDEQIWWRGAEAQNAVGNLVLHLSGNLTQWILETLGGEPPSRNRDAEFAARGAASKQELKSCLQNTVARSVKVLENLPGERWEEFVTVQAHHVTVLEAVYHVVEHFSLHTGQIL